jgi:PAS domain S-box-containing protein
MVDPRDLEHWGRTFQSASVVLNAFKVEVQAGGADGRRRWYLLRGIPCSAGPEAGTYWGTAVDITAGKCRENAARETEDRYKALADLQDRATVGLDTELCVRAWNGRAVALTGIPETTAVGRTLSELPPPFGGAAATEACRRALHARGEETVTVPGFGGVVGLRILPFRSGVLLIERDIDDPAPGSDDPTSRREHSRELLQSVLQSTNDIVVVQDPEGAYMYFNAPRAWGISMEDVAGRKPHEIFPAELAGQIVRRVQSVCATGEPMDDQTTVEWRGRRYWFQDHLSPVRDEHGTVISVVSVSRDVTGQRQAEVHLSESESMYRSFVEHSIEGIWKLTARQPVRTDLPVEEQVTALAHALVVEECNQAAARIYGFGSREDLIGTELGDFLPPAGPEREVILRSFVEAGYRLDAVEVKTVDRHGQVRYAVHTLVGAIADGLLLQAWGNIAEVTQRRLADREMRLLAQTITCAQDCVSITDLQDTILFVNDAFLRTYGYGEQEELAGKNITMVRGTQTSPADDAGIREKTIAGGWNGELINRRKDGSLFPVELWSSVVKGEDGAPVALVGVARDITERRRAEEQIRSSLHEKEVLLREIHHRVKNNLQIVSSLLSLQSEYIVDQEMLRFFRESQNRVKSMALVHEKLYQSTNLASVDFDGYLRELALQLVRASAADAGKIELRLDTHAVALPIDKAIPCGIIVNELVTNALKYAFPGGRGVLYVGCDTDGGQEIHLIVGDDGVGLPADFDIDHVETLGLTLVQMLCEQLQARLVVRRQATCLGTSTGVEFEIRFVAGNGREHSEEAR